MSPSKKYDEPTSSNSAAQFAGDRENDWRSEEQSAADDAAPIDRIYTSVLAAFSWLKKAVLLVPVTLSLFGMFLVMQLAMSGDESAADKAKEKAKNTAKDEKETAKNEEDEEKDDQHKATDQQPKADRQVRAPRKYLSGAVGNAMWNPSSFWAPLIVVTLVVYYAHQIMEHQHVHLKDVELFKTACPETGRRTKNAAYVKLLATTITTIGIRTHLGFLTGSISWKRQSWRIFETIVIPLTMLFHLVALVYFEIVSLFSTHPQVWRHPTTIRYRIARACQCGISGGPAASKGTTLARVSPQHMQMVSKPFDLRWYGRSLLLTILAAYNLQAFVLLVRRFISQTASHVDLAMVFMIISGSTALAQSATITLINVDWVVKETFSPCTEQPCHFAECIQLKMDRELPQIAGDFVFFGIKMTGVPRLILHMVAGGHLQFLFVIPSEHKPWGLIYQTASVYFIWKFTLRFVVILGVSRMLCRDLMESDPKGPPSNAEDPPSRVAGTEEKAPLISSPDTEIAPASKDSSTPDSPAAAPEELASPAQSRLSKILGSVWVIGAASSLLAIGYLCFGLLCTALLLAYLFVPFVSMVLYIVSESATWQVLGIDEACPQLWRDSLEGVFWWF